MNKRSITHCDGGDDNSKKPKLSSEAAVGIARAPSPLLMSTPTHTLKPLKKLPPITPPSFSIMHNPDISSPPDDKTSLGNVPPEMFENLGKAMKEEVMNTSLSCDPRQPSIVHVPSSDDEEFDLFSGTGANNIISSNSSSRIGSRNEIYGCQYACKYIVTAHMGKNGPHSDEKIYDREFLSHLFDSIKKRNALGPEGMLDTDLLCNRLKIHSVKMMRNQREKKAKMFRYSQGGQGAFHLFVRVFTKKQVKEGLNSEEEMMNWLEEIRVAFCATKAQYPLRLSMGGILGRHHTHTCALDTMMMDADVAKYARMIYLKKIRDGTLMNDLKKVNQFFHCGMRIWPETF